MRVRGPGRFAALALLLAAAGCGNGGGGNEAFAVAIKRPAAVVYAPLSAADVKDAGFAFPGMVVERSRPSDNEILYTIPGTADSPATIRLLLESRDGGEATVVHAFVHVPAVHATIDGQEKVLSEQKVETELQHVVEATGHSLEMGSAGQADTLRLSGLLVGIAIATNKTYLAQALDFKANPARLAAAMLAFGDPGELTQTAATARDDPMVDPEAAQQEHEESEARDDAARQEAADKAAEPANDIDR